MTESAWAAGRTALVTGATSGIGEAIARRLHAGGAMVIATGRRVERLKALAADLGGERVRIASLDVADRAGVATFAQSLPAELDILIDNAGLALGLGPADAADLDDWERMIDVNVKGAVYVVRACLPLLKARPRADMVHLGSVAGIYPYPGGNVYGATKAFLAQFSLNLRADLLGSNVRSCVIEPGMVDTEFSSVRFGGDKARAEAVYQGMRPMSADDVAEAVEMVLRLPAHVNVNRLELMPVAQAFAPFAVKRDGA